MEARRRIQIESKEIFDTIVYPYIKKNLVKDYSTELIYYMQNYNPKKIILVGLGPHAKRIYYPLLEKFSNIMNFKLVLIVDLEEKREDIKKYLDSRKSNTELFFIPQEKKTYDSLHPDVEKILDDVVKKENVDGVIISTEPLVHMMYAKWALKNNLSVLMDKPISAYKNISTRIDLAKKLITDFDELVDLYKNAMKINPRITFSVMSQRRFHPAFKKVKELINECFEKTNCPVTSIQTFHCDGQWRMPTEIVDQLYHPYMQGYGKCCHSGYHFFDIVPFLLEAGLSNNKFYDNIEVFANFLRPLDFIEQFTLEDYGAIFGKDVFCKYNKYNREQLKSLMKNFGEIDVFSNICFKKGKNILTMASINLAHNGFSRRYWPTAIGRDLYKGNGRIRHEFHIIEQGPFQSIHIHSYQSSEVGVGIEDSLYELGGEYHMEIYVFRNSEMIGGKPVEVINIKNLLNPILSGSSRGHQEDARLLGFIEFVESLCNLRDREHMTSDLLTHRAGVHIMSAVYQSAISQMNGSSGKIKIDFIINGIGDVKN